MNTTANEHKTNTHAMNSYKNQSLVFTLGALIGISSALGQPCSSQKGQLLIDQGSYQHAIREFSCVIEADPTAVEGYRGRIEAQILLGRYSDALRDYTRVTAFVLPLHPNARTTILAGYDARLAIAPDNIAALTGASFARWYFFEYAQANHLLNHLLDVDPDNVYGNLLRGSGRLLKNGSDRLGAADLDRAIALAPESPDVRWIVADAYTYGVFDPERAFAEAMLALEWGLDTPRVHAILGSAYLAFGDLFAAAVHIQRHIDLVTTALLSASPLMPGASLDLAFVPGRSYEIPVPALAGETVAIATSSRDYWDSILVLLTPDGSPVLGSDDANASMAAFKWVAPATGTYRLQVTFFESVITGSMKVTRD